MMIFFILYIFFNIVNNRFIDDKVYTTLPKYLYTSYTSLYVCRHMTRKKLTLTINEEVLKKYKKFCEDNDTIISRRIERFMKKEMKK